MACDTNITDKFQTDTIEVSPRASLPHSALLILSCHFAMFACHAIANKNKLQQESRSKNALHPVGPSSLKQDWWNFLFLSERWFNYFSRTGVKLQTLGGAKAHIRGREEHIKGREKKTGRGTEKESGRPSLHLRKVH